MTNQPNLNKFKIVLETQYERTYKSIGSQNTIIVTLIEMGHFINDFYKAPANLNDFPICWKLHKIQFNQFEIKFAYNLNGEPFRVQIIDRSKEDILKRLIVWDKTDDNIDKIIYRVGTTTSIFLYSSKEQCFTDVNTNSIDLDTKLCNIARFSKDELYRFAFQKYNSITNSLFLINDIFGLAL